MQQKYSFVKFLWQQNIKAFVYFNNCLFFLNNFLKNLSTIILFSECSIAPSPAPADEVVSSSPVVNIEQMPTTHVTNVRRSTRMRITVKRE